VLGIIGAGAGIPPEMSTATSWSMAESFVLLFGYVLAFVVAVWFVAWVDRKLSSRRLFHEIYRELGIGRHPTSLAGPVAVSYERQHAAQKAPASAASAGCPPRCRALVIPAHTRASTTSLARRRVSEMPS